MGHYDVLLLGAGAALCGAAVGRVIVGSYPPPSVLAAGGTAVVLLGLREAYKREDR